MAHVTNDRARMERRRANSGRLALGYAVSMLVVTLGIVLDSGHPDVYPRVRMMQSGWTVISIPAIQYAVESGGGRTKSKSSDSKNYVPAEDPEEPHFTVSVPPLIEGDGSDDWSDGVGPSTDGVVDGTTRPAVVAPETDANYDFADVVTRDPTYDEGELASLLRYPEVARRRGVEGLVIVRATIDASGAVLNAVVVESENTLLDAAALEGIRKLHFTPADLEGKPVVCRVHVPVRFRLR